MKNWSISEIYLFLMALIGSWVVGAWIGRVIVEAKNLDALDDVEFYIAHLPWTENATEDDKTLVAGNLRAYVARGLQR